MQNGITMTDIDVETLTPEPLDDTPWDEIAENSWFCGVYRYRFDCEALIRKNDAGRFEWAIRLITDASGESEREEAGTYASFARAEKKVQTLFAEFMALCKTRKPPKSKSSLPRKANSRIERSGEPVGEADKRQLSPIPRPYLRRRRPFRYGNSKPRQAKRARMACSVWEKSHRP